MKYGDMILELLYPRRCALCDEVLPPGSGYVCDRHKSLPYVRPPVCMRCGKEVDLEERELCSDCEKHHRNFDRGFPVFNYAEPVKTGVLAIKYNNKREYCDFYCREMAKRVRPYVTGYGIQGVTYVPVHKRKKRERGYDQAQLIAAGVAKELGLPLLAGMLVRSKYTAPQKTLNNLDRANNIKESMSLGKLYPGYKSILLVDDIFTTGVTADVCAGLLKEAGVAHVYVSTLCIGKGR